MNYKKEDWNLILPAIQELLIEGYTLPQIAKKLDLTYNKVIHYYKPIKKNFKYIDYQQKQRKVEVVNASAFSFNKVYTWESLSDEDIKGYKYYESKHKAYYEIY
tara:strand:+ start:109 stop:420 length:312 start_codon:yes stop_codon:yes gene_type:complete